jgi:hypothetical protein
MEEPQNKRAEERLRYQWPVLFAVDFTETVSEGVMADVSSGGIAFLCRADENCPQVGQELALRFSIPRSEEDDSSAMTSFTRTGRVLRIDAQSNSLRQVAIQFNEPLTLKPCEEAGINLMHSKNVEQ